MSNRVIYPLNRREFLERFGRISLGTAVTAGLTGPTAVGKEPPPPKAWQPVSDRKVRVGIVGYGVCQFGAAFGFQDHPNVEIIAVSDLIPERCRALMKACR